MSSWWSVCIRSLFGTDFHGVTTERLSRNPGLSETIKIKTPSDPCHLYCCALLKPQTSASWVMNIGLVLYARASPAGHTITIAWAVLHPSPGVSRGCVVC